MAKKPSISGNGTLPVIPEIPIRVTVDVNINYQGVPTMVQLSSAEDGGGADDCPNNKFSYTIDAQNATVLSISVESKDVDNPGTSGNFTACINDASPSPKVRVLGLATENNSGGTVALTLKFLGKDVFVPAKDFTNMGNGFLKLNILTKLPL